MYIKTTRTMVRIAFPVTLLNVSTFGTFLRGISRINVNNGFTKSLCFVFKKLCKLVETPIVEFPVKFLSFSGLDSNTCQVFESKDIMWHVNYGFRYTVINIRHKPFLFSAKFFKMSFSRLSAFGLQLFTEISILASNIFNLFSIKENIVRADCNIYDTPVNTKNFTTGTFRRFFSENNMQEENVLSAIVVQCGTSNFPINILLIYSGI